MLSPNDHPLLRHRCRPSERSVHPDEASFNHVYCLKDTKQLLAAWLGIADLPSWLTPRPSIVKLKSAHQQQPGHVPGTQSEGGEALEVRALRRIRSGHQCARRSPRGVRKKSGDPGPRVGRDKVRAPGGNSGVTPDRSPPPPPPTHPPTHPTATAAIGRTTPHALSPSLPPPSHRQSDSQLKFENDHWIDFAPVLKPIGLNCLVHALQSLDESERLTSAPPPNAPEPAQPSPDGGKGAEGAPAPSTRAKVPEEHVIEHDKTVLWGKCMYYLAKEIGVTGDSIRSLKKRIHTVRVVEPVETEKEREDRDSTSPPPEPQLQQMVSLVAEDSNGQLQLLTIGSPELVLDCCEEYWNGEVLAALRLWAAG